MTNPATVIKRVGLPANALLAAFFAVPFRKYNLDLKLIRHLPGPSHLDTFAWTRNLSSIYLDWQKTRQPLTDGNSPYHRAVIVHLLPDRPQIHLDKRTITLVHFKNLVFYSVTNPAYLSGLSHLNNFFVTRKSCPLIGTVQKLMQPLQGGQLTNPPGH